MNMDRHLKFIMTRFRLGISDLLIHHYRYRKHDVKDIICPLCKNARENEVHFVFSCPALNSLRNQLIPDNYTEQRK